MHHYLKNCDPIERSVNMTKIPNFANKHIFFQLLGFEQNFNETGTGNFGGRKQLPGNFEVMDKMFQIKNIFSIKQLFPTFPEVLECCSKKMLF